MLTGPSASGKTTTAHKLAAALTEMGTPAQVISLDNFFRGSQYYPRMPDGTLDFEHPDTLDMPLIRQCLQELSQTDKTVLPIYDFVREERSEQTEAIGPGGRRLHRGGHPRPHPMLTSLVPSGHVYRIYAGLREEYCQEGRRLINTQNIRLCRRVLRDAAARGRSPEQTLAMWDRVLDGETRYIKGFKNTADFLAGYRFQLRAGDHRGAAARGGPQDVPRQPLHRNVGRGGPAALSMCSLWTVSSSPPGAMLREFYAGVGGDGSKV